MEENFQSAEAIKDIRRMMDRSSRFISLSGLSGISAGICALVGACVAYPYIFRHKNIIINYNLAMSQLISDDYKLIFNTRLFWIGAATFAAAFISAFFFTWLKSRKQGIPIWGTTSKRLMLNVSIPMIAGAIFLLQLIHANSIGLVAPGCLIFYGLALINASKYTLEEVRYLGYCQIVLGLVNLAYIGNGLYFWAAGFGLMHILYGTYMWMKYEKKQQGNSIQ